MIPPNVRRVRVLTGFEGPGSAAHNAALVYRVDDPSLPGVERIWIETGILGAGGPGSVMGVSYVRFVSSGYKGNTRPVYVVNPEVLGRI